MTETQATIHPDAEEQEALRPETLEEAAGRRLLVSVDTLTRIDLLFLRVLRTRGHAPLVERLVLRYTRMGEHAALWHAVAVVGVLLDRRRRAVYARSMFAIAATQTANFLAANTLAAARPLIVGTSGGLSTPSAHASTSFAAATSLSEAVPRLPLWAAALVMTLSRPYMGVHYPSDSLAGAALGTLVARGARSAQRSLTER